MRNYLRPPQAVTVPHDGQAQFERHGKRTPHVTSRNQPASSARPANFARRSTFQPATTGLVRSQVRRLRRLSAAAARRARDEFDGYGDSILLTELEAAAVSGVSHNTLKFWRLTKSAKGPRAVYLHKMPRYEAGEIRRWRTALQASKADERAEHLGTGTAQR